MCTILHFYLKNKCFEEIIEHQKKVDLGAVKISTRYCLI